MTATTESVQEPTNSLKKPLYEVSTQFSHWRFSSEQLEHTRIILNAAAVDAIRKAIEVDSACGLSLCP